jgi:integrase
MSDRGVETQATAAVRAAKAALNWAVQQSESGLDLNPIRDVKVSERKSSRRPEDEEALEEMESEEEENGGRPLTDEQIGKLRWALERTNNASFRLAAMMQSCTLQRRLTVCSATKSSFSVDPETGYLVWKIPGYLMKGGRPHELPLTPLARHAYEGALAISRADSRWLFPQLRQRRKGDPMNKHMNEKSINKALYAAHATGILPKHGDGRGVRSHDIRSTFTSFMKDNGWHEEDLIKITAHSEGKRQTVLGRHYDRAKELRLKMRMLEAWEARLQEMTDKHAAEDAKATAAD